MLEFYTINLGFYEAETHKSSNYYNPAYLLILLQKKMTTMTEKGSAIRLISSEWYVTKDYCCCSYAVLLFRDLCPCNGN